MYNQSSDGNICISRIYVFTISSAANPSGPAQIPGIKIYFAFKLSVFHNDAVFTVGVLFDCKQSNTGVLPRLLGTR